MISAGQGSAADPAREAHSASPDPPTVLKGPTCKGESWDGRGREGGKRGGEIGRIRKGKGKKRREGRKEREEYTREKCEAYGPQGSAYGNHGNRVLKQKSSYNKNK